MPRKRSLLSRLTSSPRRRTSQQQWHPVHTAVCLVVGGGMVIGSLSENAIIAITSPSTVAIAAVVMAAGVMVGAKIWARRRAGKVAKKEVKVRSRADTRSGRVEGEVQYSDGPKIRRPRRPINMTHDQYVEYLKQSAQGIRVDLDSSPQRPLDDRKNGEHHGPIHDDDLPF